MWLFRLLFPSFCLICRRDGNYICRKCFFALNPVEEIICSVCDRASYRDFCHSECKDKINFEGLFFLFPYSDKFHSIIDVVKYKFYFGVCDFLGRLLAIHFRMHFKIAPELYVVTAVPIHRSKMRSRGFNQAELIGKSFAKELGLSYQNLLIRNRKTQTQVGMDRSERIRNLKNCFEFRSQSIPENVILIDDIYTTGTTVKECSEVLKNVGVQTVLVAVLAKATRL